MYLTKLYQLIKLEERIIMTKTNAERLNSLKSLNGVRFHAILLDLKNRKNWYGNIFPKELHNPTSSMDEILNVIQEFAIVKDVKRMTPMHFRMPGVVFDGDINPVMVVLVYEKNSVFRVFRLVNTSSSRKKEDNTTKFVNDRVIFTPIEGRLTHKSQPRIRKSEDEVHTLTIVLDTKNVYPQVDAVERSLFNKGLKLLQTESDVKLYGIDIHHDNFSLFRHKEATLPSIFLDKEEIIDVLKLIFVDVGELKEVDYTLKGDVVTVEPVKFNGFDYRMLIMQVGQIYFIWSYYNGDGVLERINRP